MKQKIAISDMFYQSYHWRNNPYSNGTAHWLVIITPFTKPVPNYEYDPIFQGYMFPVKPTKRQLRKLLKQVTLFM